MTQTIETPRESHTYRKLNVTTLSYNKVDCCIKKRNFSITGHWNGLTTALILAVLSGTGMRNIR